MNHRHLLPNEIDLLLDEDEEAGFGVAPLKAHVRDCAECRARLEEASVVVEALEELPLFAPSHRFADKVMAQVPVFVPWHVAAREALVGWLPSSRPARVLALAGGASIATLLTAAVLWVVTQTDLLGVATGVLGARARELVGDTLRGIATTVFGDQVFTAIQQAGVLGLGIALAAFFLAAGATIFGLRRIAVASGRRRS